MTAALEARGVSKYRGGVLVVDRVDFVAEAGQTTVIVGPNGAGKTTLFDCLWGLHPIDGGSVWHRGEDVTALTGDARARRGLARTFQRSTVFPTMTVAENLTVAAERGQRRRRADEVVADALRGLGLTRWAGVPAGQLPPGTLHLVELARALCTTPDTVMLDEPASGLDDAEVAELHDLLHRLAERGLAVVMIEHDLPLVRQTADVVMVMAGGRMVATGRTADVLDRADVAALLLGRAG